MSNATNSLHHPTPAKQFEHQFTHIVHSNDQLNQTLIHELSDCLQSIVHFAQEVEADLQLAFQLTKQPNSQIEEL
jgi:hypothetical protein